jgi:hypothetical protein
VISRDRQALPERRQYHGRAIPHYIVLFLLTSGAQAQRPLAEYGAAFLKALAQIGAISTGTRRPITVWTVNA